MSNLFWKTIENFPNYEVSKLGGVRSKDKLIPHWRGGLRLIKGRILAQINRQGYLTVNLAVLGKITIASVHRLVAQAFISNPDNLPVINHKDCNKHNNESSNLEWSTISHNSQHSWDNGLQTISNRVRNELGQFK